MVTGFEGQLWDVWAYDHMSESRLGWMSDLKVSPVSNPNMSNFDMNYNNFKKYQPILR